MVGGFEAAPPPQLPPRVHRRDIAADRWIWRAIGAGIIAYCVVSVVAWQLIDGFAAPSFPFVAGAGVLIGLVFLASRPTRMGSPWNHAAVAAGYLLPVLALAEAAPRASWAVATALLSPLLVASRLTDRRHIALHLGAFSLLLTAAAIALRVDAPTVVGVLALITNTWILGVCTVVVFEAAERQSGEIAGLLVRDPLTGAGNRRMLRDRLGEEVTRHAALQMSLVLVDLEIAGFEVLVREQGRGKANALLCEVAAEVSRVAGPAATVARVAGGRFQLLLPLTDLAEPGSREAAELEDRLAAAVASLADGDRAPVAEIGIAQYPEDAQTAEALEQVAEGRRRLETAVVAGVAADRPAPTHGAGPHPPRVRLRGRRTG